MKRNYLPPSMQYQSQSGYQSPPTPTGASNTPPSPTQGSITAGTPNYPSQTQTNQKCMKQVLETIPQGSIMGTKGSIMSGTPITSQAASPYTPTLSQFSPTHGTIVSNVSTGSITSGTPVNQPSPQNYDSKSFSNFGTNSFTNISNFAPNLGNFGSINQGSFQNPQIQGSITSGTPMNTGYQPTQVTQYQNSGSQMSSGSTTPQYQPTQNNFSNNINQGSITSGTPMNPQYSQTQNYPTPQITQGSITSGTPMTQNYQNPNPSYSNNQITYNLNSSGTNLYQNSLENFQSQGPYNSNSSNLPSGSITAGTPLQVSVSTGYNTRQRKYSGPQRVKLQMLATVQEMGNLLFFC